MSVACQISTLHRVGLHLLQVQKGSEASGPNVGLARIRLQLVPILRSLRQCVSGLGNDGPIVQEEQAGRRKNYSFLPQSARATGAKGSPCGRLLVFARGSSAMQQAKVIHLLWCFVASCFRFLAAKFLTARPSTGEVDAVLALKLRQVATPLRGEAASEAS